LGDGVKTEAERVRIARAAGLISAMTLVSRVLGLVREVVFAGLLGAGLQSDAFRIAFRVPNLLRDLFAEGALSAAFVPTYARALAAEGRPGAFRLANRVLTVLALLLGVVVVLGVVFAGPLVEALAPGYDDVPGKSQLTILLTRVMMPFLPLVAFAAVAMGMLNAEERFAVPALSPAMFNVVTVLWGVGLWLTGWPLDRVVLGWSVGTLMGGLAQFAVQVPVLRRQGWRFRPEWAPHDPGLRRLVRLMTPATVGLAAVQVNIFVNSRFASHEQGAVSWLDYAFRILYLPTGLFGVALGTIAMAGLARRAVEEDLEGLRTTLRQSLSMLAYLTIPATLGVVVLRRPIVRLLYERGRFGPDDTAATASALLLYAFGLVGYTGVKVLAPAFYALDRPRPPLVASGASVATNLAVVLTLYGRLGFRALALATAVAAIVNALLLLGLFEHRVGGLLGRRLFRRMLPIAVAATVMGVVVALAARGVEGLLGTEGFGAQLAVVLGPVLLGVGLYGALTRLLGVGEAETLSGLVRERLGGRGPYS
jgi:putative peptidoglycan lipid II flippase